MSDKITAYKWLTPDHRGAYGHGDYRAYRPHGTRPGKWTERVEPRQCATGWHVTDVSHLWNHWKMGGTLYVAECRGASSVASDKTAWESIRLVRPVGVLTKEIAVAFACDAAERVLPLFEQQFPGDDRPRRAIEAARREGAADVDAYAASAAAFFSAADAVAATGSSSAAAASAAFFSAADAVAAAVDAAASAAAAAANAAAASAAAAAGSNAAFYADANAAAAADAASAAAFFSAADAVAADAFSDAWRRWAGERLLALLGGA